MERIKPKENPLRNRNLSPINAVKNAHEDENSECEMDLNNGCFIFNFRYAK